MQTGLLRISVRNYFQLPIDYVNKSILFSATSVPFSYFRVFYVLYSVILYRKIHYLTREFRVKLHAKTDIARIAKR